MFFSTRNQKLRLPVSKAILKGLSDDGGLFLPEEIKAVKVDESMLEYNYSELAFVILRQYLDDFTDEEIKAALDSAYDNNHFEEKVMDVTIFKRFSFMELFHGQTLTFKDMALSLLPYLMSTAKRKYPGSKNIKILTATSGDTGSAVLSSFSAIHDIDVNILYPDGGIAPIQEKQMLYFTKDNARAYALADSNFDTCQSLVKSMLIKADKEAGYTSANSINIGRLLPQIVYYYYTYLQLVRRGEVKLGEKIDFIVPTGNFGDIFAGYLAKKMSLPIDKLVIASNENRILTDFLATGTYDLHRDFLKTNSPSMDILISSNLERLLYCVYQDSDAVSSLMKDLKEKKQFTVTPEILSQLRKDFAAYSGNQQETDKAIQDCYQKYHYVLDPHTAVAYHCYLQYQKEAVHHCVIVSTASPLKFPATIADALAIPYQDDLDALNAILNHTGMMLPKALKKVLSCQTPKELVNVNDVEHMIFLPHYVTIKTPATSANLGCGFDVAGIALSLYNEFKFEKANQDELVGFGSIPEDKNMVYSTYRYVFQKLSLPYVPIRITQLSQQIPFARGLGSSASCIVAGLLGANEILHHKLSKEEIYQMAIELEGHPDNVAPCLFGGMVSNLKTDTGYQHYSYPVNNNLSFLLIIPEQVLKTADARAALKKEYPLSDVSYNLSHCMLLPKAMETGDLSLLKEVFNDKIHVPYRCKLINEYSYFEDCLKEYPFTISGAGSTMLTIMEKAKEKEVYSLLLEKAKGKSVAIQALSVDHDGAKVTRGTYHE